jgi:Response regulator containing CheY-like receiver domain and AraC-type DNA-binding domain
MRFLIIDDDIGVRKTISYLIEKYHLGVIVANCDDGLEAESVIHELRPDIVVVDLLLPGQSGVELVKKINNVNKDISFIMISACSNESLITEAYNSGIEFYLQKPINALDFTSVIKKIIQK